MTNTRSPVTNSSRECFGSRARSFASAGTFPAPVTTNNTQPAVEDRVRQSSFADAPGTVRVSATLEMGFRQ